MIVSNCQCPIIHVVIFMIWEIDLVHRFRTVAKRYGIKRLIIKWLFVALIIKNHFCRLWSHVRMVIFHKLSCVWTCSGCTACLRWPYLSCQTVNFLSELTMIGWKFHPCLQDHADLIFHYNIPDCQRVLNTWI